jgi:hypothetical protein
MSIYIVLASRYHDKCDEYIYGVASQKREIKRLK